MSEPRSLKTALVTGGAKRIGRAIVEDLAAHGFAVAIHTRHSSAEAETLAAELRQKGAKATVLCCNLFDIEETEDLVAKACSALGPLDLLVNNASTFEDDSALHFDANLFEAHFALHVRAPSILAAAFVRQLPPGYSGSIVNVIDQRVWRLTPRFYSYTLSKAALWAATQTMAQAFAPQVRVNAIGPGPTLANQRQEEQDFNRQVEALILKAGPQLGEIGRTVRFLFDTPSMTGQMIALDGGQHLAWQTPDVAETKE